MTCEDSSKPEDQPILLVTIGLLLWFVLSGLAAGYVATRSDPDDLWRALDNLAGLTPLIGLHPAV
jgi:hypothetical protein